MAAGRVYYQPSAFDPASARGSDEIAAPDSALTGWSAAATIAARLGQCSRMTPETRAQLDAACVP